MMSNLLTENEVIAKMAQHLKRRGFIIDRICNTSQKGVDIDARKGSRRVLIEAKGATSSKDTSSRYGLEFNKNQKKSHIAAAVFKSLELKQVFNCEVWIAFPRDEEHMQIVKSINKALAPTNVEFYAVPTMGHGRIQKV